MNISNEVKSAHRHLSNCSVKFLEYIKENPGALKRSNYSNFDGFLHDDTIVMQPWPVFINKTRRLEMEEAAVSVFNLVKSIPRRFFNNDPRQISRYYRIPLELVNLQLIAAQNTYLKGIIGRGDFILSSSGLKCLEYNVSANLGGLQISIWEQIYLGTPIIANFLKKNKIKTVNKNLIHILCRHLVDTALERFGNVDEINSVFLVPGYQIGSHKAPIEMYMEGVYKYILQQKRQNLKGETYVADFHHLEVKEEHVILHNKKIHNLVELYARVAPIRILNAYRAGNVMLYNGPMHFLLGNKLNIALLSEHQDTDMFSQEEKKMIEKYIPWTRLVADVETTYRNRKINLKDFIVANREKLVLKPAEGYGGFDICIGRHTPDSQWRKKIESALKTDNDWENRTINLDIFLENARNAEDFALSENKWVVQEYMQSFPYLFQVGEEGCAEHRTTWGFFVFGSTYSGGWVRLLPITHDRGVINRHQGAEECVLFEVDEVDE